MFEKNIKNFIVGPYTLVIRTSAKEILFHMHIGHSKISMIQL